MSAIGPNQAFGIAHVRFLGSSEHGCRAAKCLLLPKADIGSAVDTTRVFIAISGALFQLGEADEPHEIVIESSSYISKTKGLAELRNVRLVRYAKRHHC